MNKCKVGFIGYGNMAKAIAKSFYGNPNISGVYAYDINSDSLDNYAEMQKSASDTVAKSDFIFLSVKPQMAEAALSGIDFAGKVVISIMAGITLNRLHQIVGAKTRLVRVMPNLCARVGKAVNAYCFEELTDEEHIAVKEFLNSFGLAANLAESFFDTITGLTGSSPAYTFRYAKALTECGIEHGLSFEQSKELVLYCVSACMDVLKSANSLAEMQTTIENVCSKGGTTIEGIYKLDEGKFDQTVINAINAAIKRSEELGKK